jgi:hypothetical protein
LIVCGPRSWPKPTSCWCRTSGNPLANRTPGRR